MSKELENNKRIVKNTLALYLRMLLVMFISLYTSRVILKVLGVEDFGIYNLVAGVVVLFSFLNSAMMNACQRYLNVSIGKNDYQETQKTFSASLVLHFILIGLIILLAETVGLWFIETQLKIPTERADVALIVYHIAILTTCVNVMKVPYNSMVIANEDMAFFAYTGIVEVILKLFIVFMLFLSEFDKLITYSCLLLCVQGLLLTWYVHFTHKHYKDARFKLKVEKKLIKEMGSFSGWSLVGSIADLSYKQGTNFILNIFCGVTLNATMGIVNQIRSAVFSFTTNFQIAANPQIIKSYAVKDHTYFANLVCQLSKYSYFLMLIICLPIIFNADYLLNLWLVNPPMYSVSFTILVMIFCLVDSLNGALWVSMQATGSIKKYQLATSFCLLMNLPISYMALRNGLVPESVLIIQIVIAMFTVGVRMVFSHKCVNISISQFTKQVLYPIVSASIFPILLTYWSTFYLSGFLRFLVTSSLCVLSIIVSIYFLGLRKNERVVLKTQIRKKLCKHT